MKRKDVQEILNGLNDHIDAITDDKAKLVIKVLLNLVEHLVQDLDKLQEENQELRNEINRLKGGPNKPDTNQIFALKPIRTFPLRKIENVKRIRRRNLKGKMTKLLLTVL